MKTRREQLAYMTGLVEYSGDPGLESAYQFGRGKMTGGKSKGKPVIQLDMNTREVIDEFRSAREAGRRCFLSYQAVLDNCNHKSRTSGGYIFMFAEEYERLAN
ncbi:hypothetical protein [Bacillus cereus]|uniref:hypothetical protein n=1 Tax=Bacillus cereus TaxID=1396 RepID=UPI0024817719|nr:hypothetical protein [Bacillus cereus]MDH8003018.1 hypothetical protein [Bacillus cereus]